MTVTLADVEAAARAIAGAVVATPCLHSRTLSAIAGTELFVKFENLQYTASFKERGALNMLLALTPAETARGVVTFSAGNHAQGVAYHARRLGIRATIVMPRTTPFSKVGQTEALGAEVVLAGDSIAEAAAEAESLIARDGFVLVPPFDDDRIIAGQGTIALEMLAAVPELDVLVVPVGGGGMIAGIAVAAQAMKPGIEVVGAEVDAYPSLVTALGGNAPARGGSTVAEGIAVPRIGERPLALLQGRVGEVILVSESEVETAVRLLLEIEKTVAEGAGAAALAAVLKERSRFAGRRTGIVLSGGNIDSRLLASILMRGLVRDGRIVRLRVEALDTPGTLAAVAHCIGESGGNIIEVYHQRLFSDVPVKSADLELVVEARDARQVEAILAKLSSSGFNPRRLGDRAAGGD